MAISEEKRKLIRRRLAQGRSLAEIAEEAGVSERTVRRVKQKTPEKTYKAAEDTGDAAIKVTNNWTREEEKFAAKLKGLKELYEDDLEGWAYHIAKGDLRRRTSGMWWTFIAYPESAPEGWMERLRMTGMEVAISPLHDKDKWDHDSPEMVDAETGEIIPKGARYKAGDAKKAHWHGIIKSDKSMSWQDVQATIRTITQGPYLQKCRSLKGEYEYFTHKNHPQKFQNYDKDEIVAMNGFHLEPNRYEVAIMQCDIIRAVYDHKMTEMRELVGHYKDNPEYIMVIAAKPGIFTSLLRSLWNEAHPEGKVQRTVTKMMIVDAEEDLNYGED